MTTRLPTVFIPHGGGPWPFIDGSIFGPQGMWAQMRRYMEGLAQTPRDTPNALLVISAHWEAPVVTVQTAPQPPMLYDYYGFPDEAYHVQWSAPGAPEVAAEVKSLLDKVGVQTGEDAERGFDHGVFVPLKLAYPEADVPTMQLSLHASLNPKLHLDIGRAIAPLRDQGVFIIGSGMSYHNLAAFKTNLAGEPTPIEEDSLAFDDWLCASMALDPDARAARLERWTEAPAARASHPRAEHLLPLMVVAGAAGADSATLPYRDKVMGAYVSAVHFG